MGTVLIVILLLMSIWWIPSDLPPLHADQRRHGPVFIRDVSGECWQMYDAFLLSDVMHVEAKECDSRTVPGAR